MRSRMELTTFMFVGCGLDNKASSFKGMIIKKLLFYTNGIAITTVKAIPDL